MTDGQGTKAGARPASVPGPPAPAPPRTRLPAPYGADLVPWWRRVGNAITTALESRRALVLQPFALIAGILLYRAAPDEPAGWAVILLFIAALIAVFLARRTFLALHAATLTTALIAGFGLLPLQGAIHGTPMLHGEAYGTYRMHVDGIHSDDGEDARIIVSGLTPVDGADPLAIHRARLFMPSANRPPIGAQIEARLRLYQVPGPVLPDSYDSQFQSYFDGIGAFGSTLGDVTIIAPPEGFNPLAVIAGLRTAIGLRVDRALSGPADGIERALLIGDQGRITDATRADMAQAGLAHVLAISGLHLSLVAGGIFVLFRYGLALSYSLTLRTDLKRIAAMAGIVVALFYLAISGASVSAVRSTIMLVLVFGAVLAGRRALTMRNVAIAALLVVLTDPAVIFRPGFQLSFAAVTALVGVYEIWRPAPRENLSWPGRGMRILAGLALTSLIAGLATGLFAAFHFQQMAPLGVLGNIFAVPLLALIVLPFGFLGVLMIPLGFDAPLFRISGWGIDRITSVAHWVAGLSAPWTSVPNISVLAIFIAFVALGWFAFFRTRLRYAGILAALPLILLFGLRAPPDLLIADSTQALALRTGTGLSLMAGRNGTFAVNAWQAATGEEISGMNRDPVCDESGCFVTSSRGFSLAYVTARDAFAEDCRAADLVVTRMVAPEACAAHAQVIDAGDLARGGVHWARWTGERFAVRPAITDPARPWRP